MTGTFEQFSAKTGFFYFPDVLKHFFKVKNILAFLYLALNYGLTFLFFYALDGSIEEGFLGAAIVFLFSTFIALSPIGEWIIRKIQKFRRIEEGKKSLNKLNPLFYEVVSRAREQHPDFCLDKHLQFYIKDDPRPNTYTIGRRTLCVTTGLLNCTDDHIRAVLAHEVYHLIHHETDLVLLISAGNAFLTTAALIVRFVLFIGTTVMSIFFSFFDSNEGFFMSVITAIGGLLQLVCVNLILWLWTNLGVLLVKNGSKKAEYAADAFACDLDYGEGLISFFYRLQGYEGIYTNILYDSIFERLKEETSVFSVVSRKHPKTEKRIERTEKQLIQMYDEFEGTEHID